MSSDDALTLAVVAHLQTLQDDPANAGDRAEQLEVASQCLCDAFDVDGSTEPEFSLAEVYEAGMAALTGNADAMSDAFAKFIHDVSKKGFFEGCDKGSPQFDERFQRAKKKFFDKHKPSTSAKPIPAPAPAAPPAAPSEEDKAAAQAAKADGNNKLRAGDLDGALKAYTDAIELDPTCAIFYANRAAVYTKMAGTENFELAVADCQEALAADPTYVKAYSRLGLAYYHLERYEEAVNEGYSKAVELDPSNASAQKDLENAKKKLNAANASKSTGGGGAAPPTDPLAAMMAGLGGGGGGGMPDMSNIMGMMQDPAIQQMAQQMMGGGGGGVPDLSGLMSAMGGAGAGGGGGPTVEEEPASDSGAGADDGAELYDDDDAADDDNDVSLAAQAAGDEQEAADSDATEADNPMAAMEQKIENNPRLKAIMEEVKTNPMAMMQYMNDPEVMSLVGDMMGGLMGGGGGAGGNPLAAMMAQMGGAGGAGAAAQPAPNVEDAEDLGEVN